MQLVPPGTQSTEDQAPSQESIWDLLDSPLARKQQPETSATKLLEVGEPTSLEIAAIKNKIQTKLQAEDVDSALPSPASVDSGSEFQHAFDPPKLPFLMESTLVCEHSVCNDIDTVSNKDSNTSKAKKPETVGSEKKVDISKDEANAPQAMPVTVRHDL